MKHMFHWVQEASVRLFAEYWTDVTIPVRDGRGKRPKTCTGISQAREMILLTLKAWYGKEKKLCILGARYISVSEGFTG